MTGLVIDVKSLESPLAKFSIVYKSPSMEL